MKKLKYALALTLMLQPTPVFASGDVVQVLALFLELFMPVPLVISLFIIKLNGAGKLRFFAITLLAILLAFMGTRAVSLMEIRGAINMENRNTILFFILCAPLVVAIFSYQILKKSYKKD